MTNKTNKDQEQAKAPRGFAAMSASKQRSIARMGGLAISKDRRRMAKLGRLGGLNSHKNTNPKGN